MFVKFYITSVLCIFIIQSLSLKSSELKKSDRINYLLQGKIKDLKTHQVVLMTEKETTNLYPKTGNLIKKIKQSSPTITVNFKPKTNWVTNNLVQLPSLINPRRTTIFILITDSTSNTDNFGLSGRIKFLNRLSEEHSRPRCLIIHLLKKKNFAYRKLLREMWSKQFLDASVLQVVEKNFSHHAILSNGFQDSAMIYSFNPFTSIFTRQTLYSELPLFPNKLKDMHGYGIKVSFIHDPPLLNVQRNNTNHPVKISGPMENCWLVLSNKLNFTRIFVNSSEENLGLPSCNKANFTGLLSRIAYNKVQFLGNYVNYLHDCSTKFFSKSRFLDVEVFSAVVPKVTDITLTAQVSVNALYTLLIAFMVIYLLWVIVLFLKFDKNIWNPFYILQAALGISVERESRKVAERVFFCSIILTNVVYLGYFHTMLTDTNITMKSAREINNIEDLEKSALSPMIHPLLFKMIADSHIGYRLNLRNKFVPFPGNATAMDCINYLIKYRNVTCLMRGTIARLLIKKYTQHQIIPNLKILDEPILYSWRVFIFEPRSPYVERFNKELLTFMETGLFGQWDNITSFAERKLARHEDIVSTRLSINVFLIPAMGYLISFVVFVCEMLLDLFRRKQY